MKNSLENVKSVDRSVFCNVDEFLQKIDEGETDYREGRTEDAFEWLARVRTEHVQNMENKRV